VAGFNQYFFGSAGDEAWRYGIATDYQLSPDVSTGVEFAARDLDVVIAVGLTPISRDWEERMGRGYLYWTPASNLALSLEYLYELFEREEAGGFTGVEQFSELQTHRIPIRVRYFSPFGVSGSLKATYIHQDGRYTIHQFPMGFVTKPGEDRFWVIDAALRYRLPRRLGTVTIEAKNLFDEEFKFQDTDPGNPAILPEQIVSARLTVTF